MKRRNDVPTSVLDLDFVTEQVEVRRRLLDDIDAPYAQLVMLEVEGNWFGSPWSRQRHFKWIVYAALYRRDGVWVDHAEDLARRTRWSSAWECAQPPAEALSAAEAFVMEQLFGET